MVGAAIPFMEPVTQTGSSVSRFRFPSSLPTVSNPPIHLQGALSNEVVSSSTRSLLVDLPEDGPVLGIDHVVGPSPGDARLGQIVIDMPTVLLQRQSNAVR